MDPKTHETYFLLRLKIQGAGLPEPYAVAEQLVGARIPSAAGGEVEILSADPIQQGFAPEQYHVAGIALGDGAGGTISE